MVKRLTKTGNSLALVLDKELLEQLKIDATTQLEISTAGDVIVISPVRKVTRTNRLKAAVEDAHARYAGVFGRLAK